ncbi:MAG: hypothetical protein HY815_33715 [Candidatus Riflebacteria bacterium]|nr:hypothetical protein [Candidatus Riflebacteria bacterium]
MSERDYETLFNEILVKTRERRKALKESLDRFFDEDAAKTSEILGEMMRVNDKAQAIEGNRPAFMSLMAAMRTIRSTRDEVLERIDKLMDEVRQFLSLKEEMANDRLERLTMLFREELGNRDFKFHFQLLDDQELHHLSELRSLARRSEAPGQEAPAVGRVVEPLPPPVAAAPPPPPPPPDDEPVEEPELEDDLDARFDQLSVRARGGAVESPRHASGAAVVDEGGDDDWMSAPVPGDEPEPATTLPGVPPDDRVLPEEDDLRTLPPAELETQTEETPSTSYEVDVDVLKILSDETFRPKRK